MVEIRPNRGSYLARNKGLEYSTGSIIIFIDADVIIPPGWLEKALSAIGTVDYLAAGIRIMSTGGLSTGFDARTCLACDPAPCAAVCPTSAFSQRPGGGVVVRKKQCIRCGECIGACPVDAVSQDERLLDVMRDEDHRLARFAPDPDDLLAHALSRVGIERGERLVHQDDLRFDRKRPGDGDALELAARQPCAPLADRGVEAPREPLDELGRMHAVHFPNTDDVYADGETLTYSVSSSTGGNYEALDISGASAIVAVTDTSSPVTVSFATPSSSGWSPADSVRASRSRTSISCTRRSRRG